MHFNIRFTIVLLIIVALPLVFGFTPSLANPTSQDISPNKAISATTISGGEDCSELLINGTFESGKINPWIESSNHTNTLISTVRPRESEYSVFLGNANRADDQFYQEIILPIDATSLTLSYWYTIQASESPDQDAMSITLRSGKGERLRTLNNINAETNLDWQQATHDLMNYRGQSLQIHFRGLIGSGNSSNFSVDDISLQACGVPASEHKLFLPLLEGGE